MTTKSKAVVLGNCQAPLIANYLIAGGAPVTIQSLPLVFEMTEDMRENVTAELDSADFIFAQRVADDYPLPWLSTSRLSERYGDRVVSWPNIYFDGYFPDVQYLYRPEWNKVLSPLEDYHFARVIHAFLSGRTAAQALAEWIHADDNSDPFEASFQRLRERESGLRVAISDFIAENVSQRRSFYTPNHPYPFVLAEMARRLADTAALAFDANNAKQVEYRLDRIYIPTHKAIQRSKKLRFDYIPIYRGVEVLSCENHQIRIGKSRGFDAAQLVDAYYRIYEVVFAAASSAAALNS